MRSPHSLRSSLLPLFACTALALAFSAGCSRGEIHEAYRIPTATSTVRGAGLEETATEVRQAPSPFIAWTPDGGRTWYWLAPIVPATIPPPPLNPGGAP